MVDNLAIDVDMDGNPYYIKKDGHVYKQDGSTEQIILDDDGCFANGLKVIDDELIVNGRECPKPD